MYASRELFRNEDFAAIYCENFGRCSVPPSLLAIALILQAHDKVSDAEATTRAAVDMRWKVALDVRMDQRPFAKSTLQLFRAQLVIHDEAQGIFTGSLEFARQTGHLSGRKARVVGLGLRQSRYFGRAKMQFQALLAASVANLTLIAN